MVTWCWSSTQHPRRSRHRQCQATEAQIERGAIHWLGLTLASILSLLTILLELVAAQRKNEVMCKAFVAFTGVGYTWLLYNLLLALIDRYVAIVHPIWYRKVHHRFSAFNV